jgi:hypothetical protein
VPPPDEDTTEEVDAAEAGEENEDEEAEERAEGTEGEGTPGWVCDEPRGSRKMNENVNKIVLTSNTKNIISDTICHDRGIAGNSRKPIS